MIRIVEKSTLPKNVFGQKAEPKLMAQAIRVFLSNQRQGNQSALTRAEVNRTRKKVYKQKGTGGARHGDKKAPIFVGGGITFAPKPRSYAMDMPQKMKQKALFGALTEASEDKRLVVVSDLGSLSGKTSQLAKFLNETNKDSLNCLIVTDKYNKHIWQAGRNLPFVTICPFSQLTTYDTIKAKMIFMMEEVLTSVKKKA